MRTRSASKESHADASRPFFSVQRAPASSFFSQSAFAAASQAGPEVAHAESQAAHTVQRKCAACEADTRILPQLEVGPVDDPLETEADVMADHVVRRQAADVDDDDQRHANLLQAKAKDTVSVQRKCTACEAETRIQPQLEVGPVDDPLETEADVMADRVVRRQAADVDDDDVRHAMPLQAKAKDTASSESTTSGFDTALTSANGSGAPLASHTRDQMEGAFGADFSGVRVHTGADSAAMNEEIGARAFTYGNDIHFNDGEFAPGTERGTHLLAHELTHVVQQNSGVRRAPKRIQAKLFVFGPPTGIPTGTQIHNYGVLPLFDATGLNEGLWVDRPGRSCAVPGANKDGVGRGLVGKPDFYRDNAPNGVPIGINVDKRGGLDRLRGAIAVAAPRPPARRDGPVRDLAEAPHKIELGDLKPGHSSEESLGADQLRYYSTGIKDTAKAVNDYQERREYPERWDPFPNPQPMDHLDIPPRVATSSSGGVRYSRLDVWEWRGRKAVQYATTPLMGSLIVYKSSVNGVWAYEWMPESVPATLGDDFYVQQLLDRLNNDVQPRLQSSTTPTPKLKDSPVAARQRPLRQAVRRLLRRKPKKHEKFDEKAWLGAYNPWRTDAEKSLGDPKIKKNEAVLEALTDGKKRTGVDLKIPDTVKERAQGFEKVRHWVRYGKLYGWFRKTFDRVYVKLAGFAQSVKEKVKRLTKSGSAGFGNWIKAAALALFKVAKKLGAWAVSMIVDKLLDSLQEGVRSAIKKLAAAATPEEVKSKIQEVEDLKAKYEQMLSEAQEKLEQRLFGDKLEMFSKLDKYMDIANAFSTIVSVVRWGIRILACASPPLLGCLWNLAIAALEWAFSKIMETCWFSAKVLGWVKDSNITAILEFPTEVAQTIANKGNEVLPLPAGIGPLFAEIKISHKEFPIDCTAGGGDGEGGGGPEPTEEQKALMDLAKEVGDEKFEAFLEMAAKRAADYNVALDAERIRKLGPLIKSLTIEQMKLLAANQPAEGVPVPVEEFLKEIATLTQAESERKAARNIDYDKARKANRKFHREQIKWKPELFVQSGVASDSKEFVDAIYDIQKLLGIKADGMAGPYTTKTFYERNKQAKDAAYENAVAEVERARVLAEELKRIKEILAVPYPKSAQLAKDLQSISSSFPSSEALLQVDGRKLIVTTTDGGARIGCYYKEIEITRDGVKRVLLIDISTFYTLDPIKAGDKYWAYTTIGKTVQKGNDFDFANMVFEYAQIPKAVPANSSFEGGNLWKFVQIGP